ncbi:putative membrane protein [Desulfosporosinus orientis DSM 765]|uniref:Putative membrane protein n=1 Tax=Desulfosporosinus orientis (strain ATCC 19365 / DSM 765 / NCIMB 8382 / VKM B-1628 / Singapore I) TaxID=768706 RepID=G7WI28_DESOD|nr:EamA family transporter [Desulfosporosinus orientis]AET70325.1 putative membrane protein [Desulfosporosinus orientis DSM 765]
MAFITDVRPFAVALFSILLGATGQFLFRYGMLGYGKVSAAGIWRQLGSIILTPAIFFGFACFGVSSILWLTVISRWQLSYAYPLVSLGYVIAILYGSLFLHEELTWPKVFGCLLILAGMSVLGLWGQSS